MSDALALHRLRPRPPWWRPRARHHYDTRLAYLQHLDRITRMKPLKSAPVPADRRIMDYTHHPTCTICHCPIERDLGRWVHVGPSAPASAGHDPQTRT